MIKLLKQKLIELSGRFPLLTIRIKLDPFIPSPEITENTTYELFRQYVRKTL